MLPSKPFLARRGCTAHGGGSVPAPARGTAQPWAIAEPVAAPAGISQKVLDIGDKKKEAAVQSRPHTASGTEYSSEG